MDYPTQLNFKVKNIFGDSEIQIFLYSNITTFVGTNASGKTQTLRALRDYLRNIYELKKVRYLSSNRIGDMEIYRSKVDPYGRSIDDYSLGSQDIKKIRHEIETMTGDFFTMDECKDVYIKVAERLSVLFNRQIFMRWDAGHMKVFFGKTGSDKEYSVVAEASGLINIISILSAIFDEEVDILLIDEPEVSLHPQLQSYLLHEIKNAAYKYNKTVIMATHSSKMIELDSASDLCNFVFFNTDTSPKQISRDIPELQNQKLQEFILRMGLIYKEGFFSKKVLLLEGSSDMIICHYLCNRLNLNLDVAGSQMIPVEGKGQFPIISKLFKMIGKEVYIMSDLDGFIDDNTIVDIFFQYTNSTKIASEYGYPNMQAMIRAVKKQIKTLVENNKETIIEIYKNHSYWINRETGLEDKSIQRAMIAQLFSFDERYISTWPDAENWSNLKTMIKTAFIALERLGCFFLKKGAIESYYSSIEEAIKFEGKPSIAAIEVRHLSEKTDKEIHVQYNDIIRALESASLNKTVDEIFAIKKELLSELPLVIGILDTISTEEEIYSNIKQIKGNSKSIFNYNLINKNDIKGVEVSLRSKIIDVNGFPFNAFTNDNIIQVINEKIY